MDVDITSKWLGEDITQYIVCGLQSVSGDQDFEMPPIEHGKNHGLSFMATGMADNMK
jgi:hypothetical protein